MKILILRLDAPLVSFGGPMVDQNGVVQLFPGLSMLTGLVANALGLDHRDADRLQALQERLRYAVRTDRRGEPLRDYQTVDLGQESMLPAKSGWTTRGRIAERGGASSEETHIRFRDYRADSVHTVALTLDGEDPSLDWVATALREPVRPIFLGRKCCLPAEQILLEVIEAPSLPAALARFPRIPRGDDGDLPAWWWDGDDASDALGPSTVLPVSDERDWTNQVHVGRRLMREGRVNPPPPPLSPSSPETTDG